MENIKQSKQQILDNAYTFFFKMFTNKAENYRKKKYSSFTINPFTIQATAFAISDAVNSDSIAKAVVYPFALGTSMATSFGTNTQKFIVETVENAVPSVVPGLDIEYIDSIDGETKYCQIKAGPSTINTGDIETIENHFKGLRNLARVNHLKITQDDPVVGVLYGTHADLSSVYKTIENDGYTVLAGDDFWFHLTGIQGLYDELIEQVQLAANQSGLHSAVKLMINEVKSGIESDKDIFGL
ncbi:PmeII family type II restriction endonuclease [Pediococcus pentosaceus]